MYFVEINEFSVLLARTSGSKPPLTIEAVDEFPLSQGSAELSEKILAFSKLQPGQYIQSICGIYPQERIVRRATLDNPAKARDPSFLPQYLINQCKVNLAESAVAILNASGGASFDPERQLTKEIAYCGAPKSKLIEAQNNLIKMSVFPTKLELSSVALIGGVCHYMKAMGETMPTLILDIGVSQSNVLICSNQMLDIARPIPYGLESMYPIVQKELGLKDQESAKKLFTSSTFDFTEMGNVLLKKLLKELQASTGFYEVQTGMTIGHILACGLPENLHWIPNTLSKTLGVEVLSPRYEKWFAAMQLTALPEVGLHNLGANWMGLFSLMGKYDNE